MKIEFNKLNQKQLSNLSTSLSAYKEKKLISSQSPPVLYIELTRNCIARCKFCRDRNWTNNPSYNMKDELFDILLKEYIPYASYIDLRGWGESLMLPNFSDYINKIVKLGPKMGITTTLGFDNKKALTSLIENDVFVSMTFDFADRRLYEKNRSGISYKTVISNLELLTDSMRKKGTLKDNFRFLVAPLQRKNLSQLEKILKMAKLYGIKNVAVSQLISYPNNPDLLEHNKENTLKTLKRAVQFAKEAGINLQLLRCPFEQLYFAEKLWQICPHPWLYFMVTYNGDILYCDHMLGPTMEQNEIGSLRENKETVWNGKEMQEIREKHIRMDFQNIPRKCLDCYIRGRYVDLENTFSESFNQFCVNEDVMELAFL